MNAGGPQFEDLGETDATRAEAIVELLSSRSIPAHAEPLDDATRRRIVVEAAHLARARALVGTEFPELTAPSQDSSEEPPAASDMTADQWDTAWQGIVADLGDLRVTDDRIQDAGTGVAAYQSGLSSRLVRRHGPQAGPRDYEVLEPGDEGYSPPEPPPLPLPRDHVDRFAWGATIGGPLLLVASHVLSLGTWVGGIGVAGFIAGFVTLVARMRPERDHDDPGAVV